MCIRDSTTTQDDLEKHLDEFGQEGWELVSVTADIESQNHSIIIDNYHLSIPAPYTAGYTSVMKREVIQPSRKPYLRRPDPSLDDTIPKGWI